MKYEAKKRKETYWDLPEGTPRDAEGSPIDSEGKKIRKRIRTVERLEWIAPDGTIYRSPQAAILDRARWAVLGFDQKQIDKEMAEEKE